MGNCLKGSRSNDDLSLIAENGNQSHGDHGISNFPITNDQASQQVIQRSLPFYYSVPNMSSRAVTQLGEEEQIQIAKRMGLIHHLPTGTYEEGGSSKKPRECVICMIEFMVGDSIRFLPCMHTYHVECIDDWLMRSFICPSCMEPVDAALLSTFQ